MQVEPIKPTLKVPGIKLLNLKSDKPLSNVAFKFNMRRYTTGPEASSDVEAVVEMECEAGTHANPRSLGPLAVDDDVTSLLSSLALDEVVRR